jgi:hypothetical protein
MSDWEKRMQDDFEIDIAEVVEEWKREQATKKFRRDHPWAYDITRALWDRWLTMDQLTRRLWDMRHPSGEKMPKKFVQTVQSTLNQHTSQSSVWRSNGAKPEDDLFYSPKGKGSGTWAVHKDRAAAWLRAKNLEHDPAPKD